MTYLANLAHRRPKRILVGAVLFLLVAGAIGAPVNSLLAAGGYNDPTSQSHLASDILQKHFDRGSLPVVFEVVAPGGADSPAARSRAVEVERVLRESNHIRQVVSYWTSPPAIAAGLKSKNGQIGLVAAEVEGSDAQAPEWAREIADEIPTSADGVIVRAGGTAILYDQVDKQSEKDLLLAEVITVPLTGLVLLWIFGSIAAAFLPLAIGLFAIVGTTAILRGLTMVTDVSIFAMNLTTAMGLALAIDYALFILNRYREEIANEIDREQALARTVNTAGRTVLYSAVTVALSLAAMAVFPMYFLRSFAYAGLAVVGLAAFAAVFIAPALIAVLGPRVEAGRGMNRTRLQAPVEKSFWYRTALRVMRRPVAVGAAVIALFLVVGSPFLNLNLGYPDDRILPPSHSARVVGDDIRTEFENNIADAVTVVLPDLSGVTDEDLSAYASDLSRVDGVSAVTSPTGVFLRGERVGPAIGRAGADGERAYLTIDTHADPLSDAGEASLEALHRVPAPAETMFTGLAQWNSDNVNGIVDRLPLALGIIAVTTFVMLFLFTGSVILPVKALLMNLLSLSATFGAMVWIFQEGNLGALGTTSIGSLVANMPVLMFCIAFGISMDYEVFLLSRIREQWLASGKTAADNERAVAVGLARTGRLVTAAAMIMAIVFAGLLISEVSTMRMFALGLALAVLADATLIRGLLVPAFIKLAGRANWWAPAPLVRLHTRFGLSEEIPRPRLDSDVAHSEPSRV
nr:MMPL family transporter [Rhodococcus sp. HNM0563]